MGRRIIVIILILGVALTAAVVGLLVLGLGIYQTSGDETVTTVVGPSTTSVSVTTSLPVTTSVPVTTSTTLGTTDLSEGQAAAAFEGAVAVFVSLAQQAADVSAALSEAGDPSDLAAPEASARAAAARGAAERARMLIGGYRDVFSGYAYEALPALSVLDELLGEATQKAGALAAATAGGSAALEAQIIRAAAADLASSAMQAQDALVTWESAIAIERDSLRTGAISTEPSDVALDRAGVIERLEVYLSTVTAVLGQRSISRLELENVFQVGANAAYSLRATTGWPPGLEDEVVGFTELIAAGELPAARAILPSLEVAIGSMQAGG